MSQTATRERTALDEFTASVQQDTGNALAVIEPHTLAVLNRSEIDAQLAVADRRPRQMKAFRQMVRDIAMIGEDAAAECIYVLPGRRKKDGTTGEEIEGPSVRWSEILTYGFGNCRAGSRVIEETHDSVVAQGIFCDLQNNVVHTAEVRRRIVDSRGRRYGIDMIAVTANAACSIAKRNAVLQGIPKPLWQDILYKEVRPFSLGVGDQSGAAKRINAAVDAFTKQGVPEGRILNKLGVTSRNQIGIDELAKLRGFFTAIRDGETTLAEVFPSGSQQQAEPDERDVLKQFSTPSPKPTPGVEDGGASPTGTAGLSTESEGIPASAPVDLLAYRQCIDALLKVAIDKDVPEPGERLEILDGALPLWSDKLGDEHFVTEAAKIAGRVIEGKLTAANARKLMDSMVP